MALLNTMSMWKLISNIVTLNLSIKAVPHKVKTATATKKQVIACLITPFYEKMQS